MEYTPHSASSVSDDLQAALLTGHPDEGEGEEPHIHMPNPSYWPLILGLFVAIAVAGVLFINSFPWILIVGAIGAVICMLGWGLEDPNAPMREKLVSVYYEERPDPWKYKIDQEVVDAQGKWLGKIRARFTRYVLVERGGLFSKVFYVPQSAIREQSKDKTLYLTISEADLEHRGLNSVPEDLYEAAPDDEVPVTSGVPQFARRPLSPAETGHYNYGRRWPGINTDASGSYHRNEVLPRPQTYVVDNVYSTEEPIPERAINPD
jgi:hypothetical protein